jgi:hypothetical protein
VEFAVATSAASSAELKIKLRSFPEPLEVCVPVRVMLHSAAPFFLRALAQRTGVSRAHREVSPIRSRDLKGLGPAAGLSPSFPSSLRLSAEDISDWPVELVVFEGGITLLLRS